MKKFVLVGYTLLFAFVGAHGQTGSWVVVKENFSVEYQSQQRLSKLSSSDFPIELYDGEIYSSVKRQKESITILYGSDTLHIENKDLLEICDIDESTRKYIQSVRSKLISPSTPGYWAINFEPLLPNYTEDDKSLKNEVLMYNGKGKKIISFKQKLSGNVEVESIARVVIPDFPTLIYYKEEIKGPLPIKVADSFYSHKEKKVYLLAEDGKLYESNSQTQYGPGDFVSSSDLVLITVQENHRIAIQSDDRLRNNLLKYNSQNKTWVESSSYKIWLLALSLIASLSCIIIFLRVIGLRLIMVDLMTTDYQDGSFKEFARANNVSAKKLIRLNESLEGYDSNEPYTTKNNEEILEKIIGKSMVKGKKSKVTRKNSEKKPDVQDNDIEVSVNPSPNANPSSEEFTVLFQQHQDWQMGQFDRIARKLDSTKDSEFNERIEALTKENSALERSLEEHTKNEEQIQSKLEEKESELSENNTKLLESRNLIELYENDVVLAKSIMEFGNSQVDLFNTVSQELDKTQNSIGKGISRGTEKEKALLLELILNKDGFENKRDWLPVLGDLSRGVITNREIVSRMPDYPGDIDKIDYLRKYFFKNLWEGWLSNTLILLDEIKWLHAFAGGNSDFSKSLVEDATQSIETILKKTNQYSDITINYVSLCENYEKHKFTRISSDKPNPLNQKIVTKKEDIIQVVNYGFKGGFDYLNETTWVIIS